MLHWEPKCYPGNPNVTRVSYQSPTHHWECSKNLSQKSKCPSFHSLTRSRGNKEKPANAAKPSEGEGKGEFGLCAMAVKGWINGDESAKEMFSRVLTERPFLLLPPLHRVPLRVGNVVEIVGPSPSAKTEILIQAAISSILPKQWKGVHYGGLERLVMYFDLDCHFDIDRLAESLKHHIIEANRSSNNISWELNEDMEGPITNFVEELSVACLRRFLYVRCYNSYEFLSTLKTLRYRLEKEIETNGVAPHFLMIDSIGAFYWADRASKAMTLGSDNRKSFSLQSVVESVVREIRKLLQDYPMLLLATKTTIFGDGSLTNEVKRSFGKWPKQETSDLKTSRSTLKYSYREYMPSVWQLFITHRILVRGSDEDIADSKHQDQSTYVCEWLLPSLSFFDKFIVQDFGISMVT